MWAGGSVSSSVCVYGGWGAGEREWEGGGNKT